MIGYPVISGLDRIELMIKNAQQSNAIYSTFIGDENNFESIEHVGEFKPVRTFK